MPSADLSIREARRIALAAQGFDRPRPTRVDIRHLRNTINRLGLLQIDYVNVLLPAQYQVPFSRLGPYDRRKLDELIYRRREFTEQWAHEASIVSFSLWPFLRYHAGKPDRRAKALQRFAEAEPAYIKRVLDFVREHGPVTANDVAPPEGKARKRDDWGWDIVKVTLEWLFVSGRLAVHERRANLARAFDLTERIVPAAVVDHLPPKADAQRELAFRAAQAHGVGTASDLADYFRMPLRDIRPGLVELVDSGVLRQVRVDGWREPAFLDPKARLPRNISANTLLSPFDPVVWYRPRAARLFDFEYRLEIFFPKPKREWGYYVLPFLMGERLVARVDLKADRKTGRLLVLAAYREAHADANSVASALGKELHTWATWLDLEGVVVGRSGNLARYLTQAVRRLE